MLRSQRSNQLIVSLAIILIGGLALAGPAHTLDHDAGHDGECVTCRTSNLTEPEATDSLAVDAPRAYPARAGLVADVLPDAPTLHSVEARGPPA